MGFFFVTIRWKGHWRIGGGLNCKHPFTWWCCVDIICDLCVLIAGKYSWGCHVCGGVVFMLFVIYARHLLVSN